MEHEKPRIGAERQNGGGHRRRGPEMEHEKPGIGAKRKDRGRDRRGRQGMEHNQPGSKQKRQNGAGHEAGRAEMAFHIQREKALSSVVISHVQTLVTTRHEAENRRRE